MIIDSAFIILVLLAAFKGFQKGLVLAVFSFLGIIIGMAAAVKLSAVVANRLGEATSISKEFLPLLAFAAVFIAVIILVRFCAKLVEKTFTFTATNWINKLAGAVLFIALYITVLSVIVFYVEKMGVLGESQVNQSITYPFIQPWAPKIIDAMGVVVPLFKDLFEQLSQFFGNVAQQISES